MNKPYYERKYGDGEMGYCDNPECYCHSNIIAEDVWVPRVNGKLRYTHDPKQSLSLNIGQTPFKLRKLGVNFSMSFGMAFIQDLEASHVIDEFKEFQKVLTEALAREIGEVRGTLAHVRTFDSEEFFPRMNFMFLEDGKNCRENLWGWDYFLSHVREKLLYKD